MKWLIAICAVGLFLPAWVWAEKMTYAIPVENNVPVYKNQVRKLYEKPVFTMSQKSVYLVTESGKNSVKILDEEGVTGWVESGLVKVIVDDRSFVFQPADVHGWLDYPQLTAIIDGEEQRMNPLVLVRSFAESLRDNVDKETVSRQTNQK
jgi:hypothetical protein